MAQERQISTIDFSQFTAFQNTIKRHIITYSGNAKMPVITIAASNVASQNASTQNNTTISPYPIFWVATTLNCYQIILSHQTITGGDSLYKNYHQSFIQLRELLVQLFLEILNINEKKSPTRIWDNTPTNLINILFDLQIRTTLQLIETRTIHPKTNERIQATEAFQSQLLAIIDAIQQRFIQVIFDIAPNMGHDFFTQIRQLLLSQKHNAAMGSTPAPNDANTFQQKLTQLLSIKEGEIKGIRDKSFPTQRTPPILLAQDKNEQNQQGQRYTGFPATKIPLSNRGSSNTTLTYTKMPNTVGTGSSPAFFDRQYTGLPSIPFTKSQYGVSFSYDDKEKDEHRYKPLPPL